MSFTKYASFESAQVLDLKGSREKPQSPTLSKVADFEEYRTEDGYLYARIRAISSRVNRNHDGWPSVELAGGQDIFNRLSRTSASPLTPRGQSDSDTEALRQQAIEAAQRQFPEVPPQDIEAHPHEGGMVVTVYQVQNGQKQGQQFQFTGSSRFTAEANSDAEYGYSTFLGKPIFVDHHNSDPDRARGVIVDAKLHVEDHKTASELDPYYSSAPDNHMPPTWVELLLEVDAKSFPKLAKAIIEGSKDSSKGIDGFSMGCDVEKSICNICKNSATTPDQYCTHVRMKGALCDYTDPKTGKKTSKRSYEDCYGVKFFEISAVFDPADETALTREVRSSVIKEGDAYQDAVQAQPPAGGPPCPDCGEPLNPQDDVNQELYPDGAWECPNFHVHNGLPMPDSDDPLVQQYQQPSAQDPTLPTDPLDELYNRPDVPHPLGDHIGSMEEALGMKTAALIKQALSARDFRMLADAIRTAPSQNQEELAHHFADHLEQTNPNFDRDRFVGACMGEPTTQRDVFNPGQGRDYPGPNPDPNMNLPGMGNISKTAQNPLPQADMLKAPEDIDTLRKEMICPVCGSDMDEETCDVCGYIEPPKGFDNPDLDAHKEDQLEGEPESEGTDPSAADPEAPQAPFLGPEPGNSTSNQTNFARVKSDMGWNVLTPQTTTTASNARVAYTNPEQETPIIPNQGSVSDEPTETVVEDQTRPVTSHVRTAQDFIAAAGATETRRNMSQKTADAASGAPAVANPDVNTDVEGVGGVDQASNEEASKADAQIEVGGEGGTGVEGVGADSTVSVDQGDEHSKNIEAIPTKTFDDGSSAVERQESPVGGDVFPSSEEGVKASNWQVTATDDGPFPVQEDNIGGGGNAEQGVSPADPVGNADERVDVLDHVTSPSNNSGPTDTWSGTDGNAVTHQQEPVTTETLEGEDIVDLNPKGSSTHIFAAFKLADQEVTLGLIPVSQKYERVAELEKLSPQELQAEGRVVSRVRTAGLSRGATRSSAKRMPVMGRSASTEKESSEAATSDIPDDAIFLK